MKRLIGYGVRDELSYKVLSRKPYRRIFRFVFDPNDPNGLVASGEEISLRF